MSFATIVRSGMLRVKGPKRPSPSLFFFPGINSKAWWEKADFTDSTNGFNWVTELENNSEAISKEYRNLTTLKNIPDQTESTLKKESDYEIKDGEHKLHAGKWDWHSFILKGKWQSEMEELCPVTTKVIKSIPGLMTDLPFSYCFFSTLQSNSSIDPHFAPCNLRVRCHLPLIVPSKLADEKGTENIQCGLRVGEVTREWEEGNALLFDDAYEHEAWNRRGSERVVLLVDVWNPDITHDERKHITEMFDSVKK